MRSLVLAACVAICGCAQIEAQKRESANQAQIETSFASLRAPRQLAEEGKIKWSEYYKIRYETLLSMPTFEGRSLMILAALDLMDAAKRVEAGQMTKDEFEGLRRRKNAEQAAYGERLQAEHRARNQAEEIAQQNAWRATSEMLQRQREENNRNSEALIRAMTRPVPQPQQPINCTSQTYGNQTYTNCR